MPVTPPPTEPAVPRPATPDDKNRLLTAVLATGGVTGTTAGLVTALTTKFSLPTALAIGLGSGALVWFVKPKLSDAEKWRDKFWATNASKCREKFLQYVVESNRNFEVKGLSTQGPLALQLDRVFVSLRMHPKERQGSGLDPVAPLPEDLTHGAHSVDHFLTPRPGVPLASLAITGAPGSGKTTLLKSIALQHARSTEKQSPLPILLYLREHAKAIQESEGYSLPKAAVADLKLNGGPETAEEWFAQLLEQGKAIVLLDGLDEVADPAARKAIAAWVARQKITYPKAACLLTSRPAGYEDNPVSGFSHVEVLPFTREQQVQFVNNWYLANEVAFQQKDDSGVRRDAKRGADELLGKIRSNAALSGLAVNPLLLTMIATVHRYRSSLPGRRVELYAEICEVFLGKRRAAIGLTDELTPAQKVSVLQELAFAMMQKGIREIPHGDAIKAIGDALSEVGPTISPEAFLKSIEHGSGLLLERESGRYAFAHLTFQEYLAARYINDPSDNKRREKVLLSRVSDPFWAETVRLYCAISSAPGAVILACLEKETTESLSLALECLGESQRLEKSVRDEAEARIAKRAESDDPEVRRLIGEAYLTRRLRNFVRESDDLEYDTSLVTGIEYELFLADQQYVFAPLHWRERHCPAGETLKPALGMRGSDVQAFCHWLTDRSLLMRIDYLGKSYRPPFAVEEYQQIDLQGGNASRALAIWALRQQEPGVNTLEAVVVADGVSNSARIEVLASRILERMTGEEEVFDRVQQTLYKVVVLVAIMYDTSRNLASPRARKVAHDIVRACELVNDLILDLESVIGNDRDITAYVAIIDDLASYLASVSAKVDHLTSYLASVSHLSGSSAIARDNIAEFANVDDLARLVYRASAFARACVADASVPDLTSYLAVSRAFASDRDRTLTKYLFGEVVGNLARDLALTLESVNSLASINDLISDLIREMARGKSDVIASDLTRDNIAEFASTLARDNIAFASARDLKSANYLAIAGVNGSAEDLAGDLVKLPTHDFLLFHSCRSSIYRVLAYKLATLEVSKKKTMEDTTAARAFAILSAVELAASPMLYLRAEGKIRPIEGIRLVRERVKTKPDNPA